MIRLMKVIALLCLSSLMTYEGYARPKTKITNQYPTIAKDAIFISGPVNGGILKLRDLLLKKQLKGAKVIDIALDSPGGSVYAGLQMINAMELVKARGTRIRCFVTTLAASMAFQILAHCDERYAFPYSLLLWHPPSLRVSKSLRKVDAVHIATELAYISTELTNKLRRELGLSDKEFFHHYHRETLFTGLRLNKIADDFITIVKNVNGLTSFTKPKLIFYLNLVPSNEMWYQYDGSIFNGGE